ncbi:MAG TPA: amino acid decarboxylase, partial [Thermoanaerobaculia bacterium]
MPKLDPSANEFRAAGHKLIDWVADYLEHIDDYRVLSSCQPGEIERQFPNEPSARGRGYDELIA